MILIAPRADAPTGCFLVPRSSFRFHLPHTERGSGENRTLVSDIISSPDLL